MEMKSDMSKTNKLRIKRIIIMCFTAMALIGVSWLVVHFKSADNIIVYADEEINLTLEHPGETNSATNCYLITGVVDMYELQEFSKYNTCEGMYFKVSPRLKNDDTMLFYTPNSSGSGIDDDDEDDGNEGEGTNYSIDLVTLNDSLLADEGDPVTIEGLKTKTWYGIGMNVCYPFKGNIDFQGILIRNDTNLFGFLGEGAVVKEVRVFGDIKADKNKTYYKQSNVALGAIATCAYIDDESGIGNTINPSTGEYYNSVTIKNCDVYSDDYNTTTITNMTTFSTGGIIAVLVGKNKKFGASSEAYACNFIIDTCRVNAVINAKGNPAGDSKKTELGTGASNGVVTNGGTTYIDKTKVKNGNLFSEFPGYIGGIIGDVTSLSSANYVSIHIRGDNKVIGSIKATAGDSGGVIGHMASKTSVRFEVTNENNVTKGSISFYDNDNACLKSIISRNANAGTTTVYAGKFVASAWYTSIIMDEDFQVVDCDKYLNNPASTQTFIPDVGGGRMKNSVPVNMYKGVDVSQESAIAGKGTASNPYILASANDFAIFARYLSTYGYFGFDLFDNNGHGSSYKSAFDYISRAYFRIENDIDISDKGINTISPQDEVAFSGVLFGKQQPDGSYPTITYNRDSASDYTALFNLVNPYKGQTVEFKNFNITGSLVGRSRVCGLIRYVKMENMSTNNCGNFKMENINNSLDITVRYSYSSYHGSPFIGDLDLSLYYKNDYNDSKRGVMTSGGYDNTSIDFINLSYSGTMDLRGGWWAPLIGQFTNVPYNKYGYYLTVNIDNFNYTGSIIGENNSSSSYYAGLISKISATGNSNKSIFDTASEYGGYTDRSSNLTSERTRFNISNVSVRGVTLDNKHSGSSIGGLLGYEWNAADYYLDGINVNDCYINYNAADFGGLVSLVYSSYVNAKNIHMTDVDINQRQNDKNCAGMMFGNLACATRADIYMDTCSIENCTITRNRYFSDIAAYALANYDATKTDARYKNLESTVNIIGADANGPYSINNPYVFKTSYINSNGVKTDNYTGYLPRTRLIYNMIPSEGASQSERNKYIIKGNGDENDPFIIDTPQKLVIISRIFNMHGNGIDSFFEFFDSDDLKVVKFKQTASNSPAGTEVAVQKQEIIRKIFLGYYVFANDLDLTGYSFEAMRVNGGKYYGFNAYSYLVNEEGKALDQITDDDVKNASVTALSYLKRDDAITLAYEEAFEDAFEALGGEAVITDPNISQKAQIEALISDSVKNEYYTLKKYKEYKPDIHFNVNAAQNSTKASTYKYCKPVYNLGLSADDVSYQARYFHASLFANISYCLGKRAVEINNIKITGSLGTSNNNTGNGSTGGLLITRTENYESTNLSNISIRNIDIGNVSYSESVKTSAGNKNRGLGLLVDAVVDTTIDFDGIRILPGSTVSGGFDALIGYQTGAKSKCEFEHIDLNEVFISDAATLDYGLFYFNFNQGLGIYWYNDGDIPDTTINADVVTPGILNISNERKVIDQDTVDDNILPYSYKSLPVDINPVTENIIHGTGTADDPFVIESEGQLLSLYLAIKNNGETAGKDRWFVGETNGTGYDENDPLTWTEDGIHNFVTWETTESTDNRVNKLEYLRTAHYAIVEDLDLSNITNKFKKCAMDFTGIGSPTLPFSGELDGEYIFDDVNKVAVKTDGVTHNITLSGGDSQSSTGFGLIKYALGVKVANLLIESPKAAVLDSDNNITGYEYTSYKMFNDTNTFYGNAIGCILGGDNIIDNVTVKGVVKSESATVSMKLGALVGYVQAGTLTFTDMPQDAFKDFNYKYYSSSSKKYYTRSDNYNYLGGYVGTINKFASVWIDSDELADENSAKLYSYDSADNAVLSQIYSSNYGINIIRKNITDSDGERMYVLNRHYFDDIEQDKIIVDGNNENGYVCHLRNEKQVLLVALALECGAMSMNTEDKNIMLPDNASVIYYPYNYYSSTYKLDSDDTTNYNTALLEYYFDFTNAHGLAGLTVEESGVGALVYKATGKSMLNTYDNALISHTSENAIVRTSEEGNEYSTWPYRTTFILENANKSTFDFAANEPDFKGFNPRSKSTSYYRYPMTFFGNFDGNNKIIHYEFSDTVTRIGIGFFNSFLYTGAKDYYNRDYEFVVRNINLTGTIGVSSDTGASYASYCGGIVGYYNTRAPWTFENINVYDFSIKNNTTDGYTYMGGLIGGCSNTENWNDGNGKNIISIKVDNCSVGNHATSNASPRVGAKRYSVVIDQNKGTGRAGGLIGSTNHCYIYNTIVDGINVRGNTTTLSENQVGGLIGMYENRGRHNKIENVVVSNNVMSTVRGNAGGLIGRIYKISGANNTYPTLSGNNITLTDNSVIVTSPGYNDNYAGQCVGRIEGGKSIHDIGILNLDINYTGKSGVTKPEKVWNNTTSNTSPNLKSEYFIINQIRDIEGAEVRYGITGGITDSDYTGETRRYTDLIATNTTNDSGEKEFVFVKEDGSPIDLVPDNDSMEDYMLLEWNSESGTMVQVVNDVLDVLTDGTGKLNSTTNKDATGDTNENITIEAIPMRVTKDGTAEEYDATAAISITKDADGNFVISSNGFYDKYAKTDKDGNYTAGTYTLIKITYHVSAFASNVLTTKNQENADNGYSETIYIPFMVTNMINVESYRRVTLGENYDEAILHNLRSMSLNITKDSSYTLYEELLYSKSRLAFEDSKVYYVKEFVLADGKPVIPKGTKLTLVDATDNKTHTYYYEVTENARTSVRLTEFTDENGNHFTERDISDEESLSTYSSKKYEAMPLSTGTPGKKSKRGIEKFIVFVDMTDILDKTITTTTSGVTQRESIWEPAIIDAGYFTDDDLNEIQSQTELEILTKDVFHYIQKCKTELRTYDGRTISFVDDSLTLDGTISKISTLRTGISFKNEASDTYWDYIKGINDDNITLQDYANQNKYIEVAISLVNDRDERILLPAGTRVKYKDATNFEPIRNTSNVYYYKESTSGGYSLMMVNSNKTDSIEVEFDFAYAKMENLPAGTYRILFELLRSNSVAYPMGSEVLDTAYSGTIRIDSSAEYGFSISDYDKSKLVFNKQLDQGVFSLDYNLKVNSTFDSSISSSKEVFVEYTLYSKTYNEITGETEYVSYNDSISQGSGVATLQIDADAIAADGYDVIKTDDLGNITQMVAEHEGELKGTVDITETDSNASAQEQIIVIHGIPGCVTDGITGEVTREDPLSIPFTLTMPDDATANNYKLMAKLYSVGRSDNPEASDFVIFNISDINVN